MERLTLFKGDTVTRWYLQLGRDIELYSEYSKKKWGFEEKGPGGVSR